MEHDEDCSEDTQWLENNQKQGELGEGVALAFLQSKYNQVKSVSHIASKEYDIEVFCEESNRILGNEIKTSRRVNKFHITYNELQKAHMIKDSYYLFFIFIEEGVNEYYGYIKTLLKSCN